MSDNALPADRDWPAVQEAARQRMRQPRITVANLSRESGVSETTIRYLSRPEKRQRSTLVALAGPLGYSYDYLPAVLMGQADGDSTEFPPEKRLILSEVQAGFQRIEDKLDDRGDAEMRLALHIEVVGYRNSDSQGRAVRSIRPLVPGGRRSVRRTVAGYELSPVTS